MVKAVGWAAQLLLALLIGFLAPAFVASPVAGYDASGHGDNGTIHASELAAIDALLGAGHFDALSTWVSRPSSDLVAGWSGTAAAAHLRQPRSLSAPRGTPGAPSAADGARLSEQLRLTEKYGAGGLRELADGRMRFYGNTKPAKTPGEVAGARLVREWDPASGAQRTWYETLDQSGTIRIVRPETGGPKVHHTFGPDGTYTGPR